MRMAKVIGTITATIKDPQLASKALLVTNIIDGKSKVLDHSIVAIDTVGAGVGDVVLLTSGSAARLPLGTASAPIDTAIIAIVEHIDVQP